MKRIGNLYWEICSFENLFEAHMKARKGKAHYTEVRKVNQDMESYLRNLEFLLKNEAYYVNSGDYRRETIIDKGKEREILKLSYYPHRIVQWAVMNVIEDVMIKNLIFDTYASIKGRGIHVAVRRFSNSLKDKKTTKYCLKMDVKKFYPNIDNTVLYSLLEKKFKDPQLLRLLKIIIFSTGEKGQPIGSLWSQFAGNFYLSAFDHWIKEIKGVKRYFRYCDDMVILHEDKEFLHKLRGEIERYLEEKLKLKLKENWQVFPVDIRGVDFLGYRFFRDYILLRKRTAKNFKKKIKKLKKKKILSHSDMCSFNSYRGWMKYCNSFRLAEKYIFPLSGKEYQDEKGNIKKIEFEEG